MIRLGQSRLVVEPNWQETERPPSDRRRRKFQSNYCKTEPGLHTLPPWEITRLFLRWRRV